MTIAPGLANRLVASRLQEAHAVTPPLTLAAASLSLARAHILDAAGWLLAQHCDKARKL